MREAPSPRSALSPQPQHGVAWVALDAGDNDPTRFWSYVCSALERASPGLGTTALAVLRAAPATVEPALAEQLNALAAHAADVVLMLDDYHAITNPAIHEQISFLLDHAPLQFHLLIASRIDPPLPLARWRARGELAEIRAADLRFSTDEALQFFAETMGLRLDAMAVAALEARTEGWAAGLQLAALSLQGQADVGSFIASFSGTHRHVVDYLVEEVLGRQPEQIRTFLLQTSILERMSAALCDFVIGKDEGGRRKEEAIVEHSVRDEPFIPRSLILHPCGAGSAEPVPDPARRGAPLVPLPSPVCRSAAPPARARAAGSCARAAPARGALV